MREGWTGGMGFMRKSATVGCDVVDEEPAIGDIVLVKTKLSLRVKDLWYECNIAGVGPLNYSLWSQILLKLL